MESSPGSCLVDPQGHTAHLAISGASETFRFNGYVRPVFFPRVYNLLNVRMVNPPDKMVYPLRTDQSITIATSQGTMQRIYLISERHTNWSRETGYSSSFVVPVDARDPLKNPETAGAAGAFLGLLALGGLAVIEARRKRRELKEGMRVTLEEALPRIAKPEVQSGVRVVLDGLVSEKRRVVLDGALNEATSEPDALEPTTTTAGVRGAGLRRRAGI